MKDNMLDPALLDALRRKEWFYRFELPNGEVLPSRTPAHIADIHPTRLAMLLRALEPVTANGWNTLTAIDIACHQGYFTSHLARKGCREVLGVDARQEHIDDCSLIGRAYGLNNLRTLRSDLFDLDPGRIGQFDITVLFGLLYHVEDPVGALRVARALTRKVCVVETQIAPGLNGYMDWGSHQYVKPIQGSFAVIDESDEFHGPEMSVTGICLCPSLDALMWIMKKVGFARVELITPPADAYEQHRYGKRAVVAGYV